MLLEEYFYKHFKIKKKLPNFTMEVKGIVLKKRLSNLLWRWEMLLKYGLDQVLKSDT